MVVTEHQPDSQERNRPFLLDKDFAQRMMQKIAGFDETITVYEASDHPDKDQHVFDLRMQKGQALAEILEFQANPNNPQVIKGIISTYPGEIIHRASQNTAHFF